MIFVEGYVFEHNGNHYVITRDGILPYEEYEQMIDNRWLELDGEENETVN